MTSKKAGGGKGPTDFRNSEKGTFTTKEWAKAHPAKSEAEHNRKPGPDHNTKRGE